MRSKKSDDDRATDLSQLFAPGRADPRLALAGVDQVGLTLATAGPAADLAPVTELERAAAAALAVHGLPIDRGPEPRARVAVELHADRSPGGAVLLVARAAAVADLLLANPGPGAAMLTVPATVLSAQKIRWATNATAGDKARELVQRLASRIGAAASDARRLAGLPGRGR